MPDINEFFNKLPDNSSKSGGGWSIFGMYRNESTLGQLSCKEIFILLLSLNLLLLIPIKLRLLLLFFPFS